MNGWTLAALLGGLIVGFFIAAHFAFTEVDDDIKSGVIIRHSVAYKVEPMKKEGE